MTGLIDYCVRRTGEILRGMSSASISDENLDVLSEIAANGFSRITELINENKNGGNINE